jgi:hypothetical protein
MRKESDSHNNFNCVICKEDRTYYSFGSCEHRKICMYCSMRSRILYKDYKCPLCSQKLDYVFFYGMEDKPSYESVINNKEELYPDDEVKENGIYYGSPSAQEEAYKLLNYLCPIRGCDPGPFNNQQQLNIHLTKVHKKSYW